jgi:hypothetical protein
MLRTLPRSLRRFRLVAGSAAAFLVVDAFALATPAGAGAPAMAPAIFTRGSSDAPSVAAIFVVGGVVALLGVVAVIVGARRGGRGRRRR